ncbi:uncharacterized protein LOC114977789 [Acropora millepora]|uniref:uncharacterized protein LOC114977789 n=1 Tax=Acropora millepora TaxID=45264 RepID=UPI001CF2B9CF|nr:uncharacterized protein LOC114977789 [Acropora millepora]
MRMWKRALTFAVLVFICPNIECKRKTDDSKKSVDCRRTNKSAFRFCTKACKSHNDCKKNQRCLCDGDCGMSCVRNNLKCNELKKTKNMIAKVSNGRSFGSVITYSCPSPYTLRGPSKRSCRAIGEWDGRKTRCRKFCRDPGEITHGNRRYTSFQVGKYITYWCFPGYNMTGNAKITCEEDRSTGNPRWSSNKPICQLPTCPRPTIPRNALIDFPRKMPKNFNYNQRVLLKCMYGYVKTSLGILACRGPSWIGGISCRPKSCGSPNEVANGRILGYLYTFKQRVTYACDEGYQIRGPLYRQCQANGKWGGDDPSCDVVNCGPLQRPDHGNIIQQVGTTFGNRIVFECTDKGYEIRGSKVRTCQSDGSWSGLPTTCELVKCDDPGTPVNGMRIVSKGLVYGGSLRFKCNRDYTLMKGMSEIIYCQATKRWTASVPQCLAPCRDPGLPRQGNRIGDDFRHDSKVTFSCPNGFLMEGVGEMSCSNGTWSNSVPTCKAPCAKLSKPANGYMSGGFRHGSQVRFVCYYRYQRIGAASSTCNDGTWSNSAPICKGICGRPRVSSRVHVHGNSFLDGDEVQFSCIANYDLFGSQRSRCVGQRWNTGIPECKARCIFGGDPDNGFAVRNAFSDRMVKHGLQIVYRCNEHYTLIGSATQRCNNGRWTNSRPSCKAPCRDPGVPRQGSRIGDDFRHGSKVSFTCRDDYNMEGVREISCSNGAWSNRVPTCKAPCVKLSRPANGYMSGDFKHRNQVRFGCYYGYQRIGAASSTCNDGTWSNSAPICKGRCGRPRVSSRGPLKLHGNSFLDGDELQFSCIANYDLFGSQRIRCVGRRWNTGIPECKARCIFGGDPGNGFAVRNAFFKRMVKHGVQIVYRCNEQYTLIGSATQECNNGRWTNARPSCRGICRRPIVPLRGPLILHGNSFLDGDEVQFSCIANYDLFGRQRSRCVGQKWNNRKPECKARCIFGGDPDNGFAVRNAFFNRTVKHGLQIVYRCNEQYTLIGSAKQECNNGQWTNARPSCKGTCGRPIIPSRGPLILHGKSFLDGDEVQFSCVANYDLFGSQRSRCYGQKWNTSVPECKARCIFGGDPDNGFAVRNVFFKRMVKHGVQIVYRCFIHYTLIGSATQECNNGQWTTARPSCKGICGRPIVPFRGPLILHGNSFLDGDEVQFSCAANYDLFGSQRSRCVGQKWNTGIPECKARCIFGGDPANGFAVRNALFNRVVKHGLQIVYRCNKHYTLIGSATQECNNGRWTSTRPSCKASCRRPEAPRNGGMRGDNFNHDEKVVFYCDENYQLVGQSQITCKDGSWSDLFPKCIVVNCGPLQRPDHGNIIEIVGTTFGNRVVFECTEKGYEIRGSKVRTCQSNGSWSGLPTTCELVKCDDPGTPVKGMRIVSKGLVYGGSLRFKCNRDYTLMKGMSEIIYCQANKRWTASVPHCLAPCQDPGVPRQGNRTGDDFRHDSKVIFTCPNNYLMEGVGEMSCSNGTWSNRVPTCKAPCVKFSRPHNGYMRGDFRHGNQVRFGCYYGYQRIGAASSTCNDGTWSNSAPICKAPCVKLSRPANGYKRGDFRHGNQVRFGCYYGYKRIGAASSTCNDGTWSNSAPICKGTCGRPIVPLRGPLILQGNSFLDGDEVKFFCAANYDLFGSQRSRCVGQKWNTGIPECKARCIFEGDPDNGFAVRDAFFNRTVKHGLQIVYRCNEHYTRIGSATQECSNGQWTNSRPSCKASCRRPEAPRNGGMRGDNFNHNEKVVFYCDENYQLVGQSQITCTDGSWSDLFPKCIVVNCGPLQRPNHGNIIEIVGTTFGNRIVFECNRKGYEIRGSKVRTCQSDGSWSGLPTTCELVKCDDPGTPVNGMRIVSKGLVYGGSLRFKCNRDYTLMKGMSEVIYCQANKRWTASVPHCLAPCVKLSRPANGYMRGDFRHGNQVRFVCYYGYQRIGAASSTCNDGTWSNSAPICKDICGRAIVSSRGPLNIHGNSFLDGDEVQFSCIANYDLLEVKKVDVLLGNEIQAYQSAKFADEFCEDGMTAYFLQCLAKSCGDPGSPENGKKKSLVFTFKSKVYFECNYGYKLVGDKYRQCQSTQKWSGQKATCELIDCGKLHTPEKAKKLVETGTGLNDRVIFECSEKGYEIRGSETRSCLENGTWSGVATSCEIISCGDPGVPIHGRQVNVSNNYKYGSFVEFDCSENYTFSGDRKIVCGETKDWSAPLPRCFAPCSDPGVPRNGTRGGNRFLSEDSVSFECHKGFELKGDKTITCVDGVWKGTTPRCEVIKCEDPGTPQNGRKKKGSRYTYNGVVKFMCDTNYTLSGKRKIKCQENKEWTGSIPKCRAPCSHPGQPKHGRIFGDNLKHNSTLKIECNTGYVVKGSTAIRCTDGKWNTAVPTCSCGDGIPLGMGNGYILDDAITSSSETQQNPAHLGRLGGNSYWCSDVERKSHMEISLPKKQRITGAVVDVVYGQRIRGFALLAKNENIWDLLSIEEVTLSGKVYLTSEKEVDTYKVRIHMSRHRNIESQVCLRAEVYGCDVECFFLVPLLFAERRNSGSFSAEKDSFFAMLLYAIILNVLLLQGVKAKEESALGICERPIVPSRGPLILHGNSFLDGDEVQFSCVANYDLFGSQRSRCVGQRWNTRIPECKARCIFGGNPGNGFAVRNALFKRMVKHGLQIVYRCNEHYALIGSATQECNNGQWTNARPSCKGICERPIVPSRGPLILHGNRFLDGDEVQFSCVANYDLFGSQRSRCVGQKWNNRKPECKARCIFGGDPDNGFVVRNAFFNRTVKHGLQIVYRCNKHYALIGSATQKCNNGQWTNARPSCKGTCGRPIIPSRGPLILLGNSFLDGDEVQFSCVADYDLFGSQRSRCVGQKWNNRKPECKARCIFGGDPDNGFAVRNAFFNRTVKHGVQIVYRCNEHYTLIGSATQECSNGQWTNTRPSCKGTCGRPIIPSRGPLILLGNSFLDGDEVQFSCVANYDLFGSQRSRCNGQKWNTSTPECKARCIFGGDPDNGFAVRNAFFKRMVKHGLQIVYRCFIHYTLIGSATRECNNGQWATARPSCKGTCGRPIVPLGGPLILHGNSFLDGDEVKFSCVANYDLFGSQRIRCFGRKWNTGIPECKARCIFGGDPDNGFAVRNAFFNRVVKHGLQIVYHCNKHHTLIGSATQECNNGQWTNTRPSCKASCRRPEPPMNGGMRGDNFNHNKKVVFYCDETYQLVGQSQITCKDGSWSDMFPKCIVVNCGPLQRPNHGNIIEIVGTTFGNRIVFECTGKGYEIRGSKVRTCQSDGSWSGLPTTCELVKCDDPGTPVNGMRIVSKGLVYGGSLRFKCNRDYTLMKGMSEIIYCQANKRWTASVPQCLAACRDPGVPRQGNRIGDDFRHGSKVIFTCRDDYIVEGVGEMSCSNGRWSNRVPTCKAPCVKFSRPGNGYMRGDFRHGNQVRFVCYYGYQRIGAASSTCNDGTWSNSAPICKGKCGRPRVSSGGPLILHGNSFLDGDEVQFSCIAIYDLFGSQKSRCVGRKWNTRIPECKARCVFGGDPDNGFAVRNAFLNRTVKHGSQIVYRCNKHYTLVGSAKQECNNGQWTNSRPSCKAPCQDPGAPSHGNRIGDDFRHGSKVIFTCPNDYAMDGVAEISCSNGTWSNRVPTCKAPCVKFSRPANGYMRGDFRHGNQVRFVCYYGYRRIGAAFSTCNDGTWSNSAPICKGRCGRPRVSSGGPLKLHGNSFLDGDELQFSCIANYDLFGSQRIRCVGRRWNTGIPECKASCQWPGRIDNGRKVGHSYKHGDTVQYVCNDGYILDGKQNLTCADGAWSSRRPACRASCRRPEPPMNGGMRGDNFNHNEKVVFYCDEIHQLVGESDITCKDGSWSDSFPICVATCLNPGEPAHGRRLSDDFQDGRTVAFECDDGFDLFGNKAIQCIGGVWNASIPECKASCVKFLRPANGYMRGDFRHGNQVRFVCYYGYQRIGAASSTCNDGTWSNSAPICKGRCGRPRVSSRGPLKVHGNSFLDGDELRFSCIANYDLFGSQRIRCVGRRWNTGIPECKARCIFGGDPDNGFVVRNAFFNRTVKHGLQIVYRCNKHYALIGSATQKCNNGHWTNARPSCKGTCGRPIIPSRGPLILLGNSFLDGDEVQFSCVADYDLFGSQRSRCVGQKWNNRKPECKARCIFGGDPDNGFAVRNAFFNRTVKHGVQIVYRCNEHYTLIGSATQECSNGQWTNTRPSCKGTCGRPIIPSRGPLILLGNSFLDGDEVQFSCVANYDLFGSQRSRCNGQKWNTSTPECKARCIFGGDPDNGFAVRNAFFKRMVKHGLQIVYRCFIHYTLIGSATRECNNGQWATARPSCKGTCGRPIVPLGGPLILHGNSFLDGDEVKFSCVANYDLFGSQRIRCFGRKWNTGIPECKARCIFGGDPDNGFAVRNAFFNRVVKHGLQIVYHCNKHHTLIGSATQECNNGQWTNTRPSCKASCRRPEPPMNGGMRGDNFNHNKKVVFYCDENYQLVGQSQITCKDGSWSDLFPKCSVVNCGPLQRPDHGNIVEIVGTTFGNRIVFECIEKGYEIRGSKVRTCQSDGSWSGLPTTCELVKCDDPGTPVNGMRIVSKGLVYGGSLRFKCNRDYTLMKGMSEIIYCQANKRWTASVPHCLAPCRDPGVPRQGSRTGDDFRHDSKVIFSCPKDHFMEGVGEIRCSNGTWSSSVPTCKAPCVKLSRPANGYMRGDFRHGNQVRFVCYYGYQRIGAASSTCNDGTWSNSAPICKGICGRPRVSPRGPLHLHGNSFLDGDEVQFSCIANYDLFGSQRIRCVGRRWSTSIPECKVYIALTITTQLE